MTLAIEWAPKFFTIYMNRHNGERLILCLSLSGRYGDDQPNWIRNYQTNDLRIFLQIHGHLGKRTFYFVIVLCVVKFIIICDKFFSHVYYRLWQSGTWKVLRRSVEKMWYDMIIGFHHFNIPYLRSYYRMGSFGPPLVNVHLRKQRTAPPWCSVIRRMGLDVAEHGSPEQ